MSSCFFIGHRETIGEMYPRLEAAIEQHITQFGVREFIVGNYGGFDRAAARALAAAKVRHPEITLLLLVPYHPAERSTEIPPGFDSTYYPPDMELVPRKLAIVRANRYIVDRVDHLIASVWHPASNAQNLMEYAIRRGVAVVNLGEGFSTRNGCRK